MADKKGGSLSDLIGMFVADAFAATSKPFVPENVKLGEYTFLPWVRSGIVAGVDGVAPGTVRGEVKVTLIVRDEAGGSQPVSKTLTVRGPGDVVGFDQSQIVRRYPSPGTTDAEDTFFVHVELDRPDFPWMFSPFAPASDRLAPWLAVVALDQSRSSIEPGKPGLYDMM